MDAWIDRFATALSDEPLSAEETVLLLAVARDVAHRVERKVTPLAAFLLGAATVREMRSGAGRDEAIASAVETLRTLLPEEPERAGGPSR